MWLVTCIIPSDLVPRDYGVDRAAGATLERGISASGRNYIRQSQFQSADNSNTGRPRIGIYSACLPPQQLSSKPERVRGWEASPRRQAGRGSGRFHFAEPASLNPNRALHGP